MARFLGDAIRKGASAPQRLHAKSLTMPHPKSYFWARFGPVVGVVVLVGSIAVAAGSNGPAARVASQDTGGSSARPLPSDSPTATTNATTDPGSTPTIEPSPVGVSTGDMVSAAGVVLPAPGRTPGAVNPAVTQDDISRTICVSGWTATVRPSSSVTTALKIRQLATGYSYKGDTVTSDYEEDHLISLELGGAPSAEGNLWPEPYTASEGARVKDQVENKLHALVCSGTISLQTAQTAIASNWWSAYQTYVTGTPLAAPAARAAPAPAAPPATTSGPPAGALALCNDGTYSTAAHHSGACSRHGGVSRFYR